MAENEGEPTSETGEASMSRAEIQRLVAETVTAALQKGGDGLTPGSSTGTAPQQTAGEWSTLTRS